MCRMFLTVPLLSSVLFHVASEFFDRSTMDTYSALYPFLEKWSRASRTKMLTIVLDDYELPEKLELPTSFLDTLGVSFKVASLKHLISLKQKNLQRDYQTVESNSCVLLLFSSMDHLRDIISSPHLVAFWHPENVYILQERSQQVMTSLEQTRFCKWALERLWRFRRVYKVLLFIGDNVIRSDPFDYAGRHTRYYVNSSCDWYCIKSNEDSFLMINEPSNTDVSDFFEEDRRDFKMCPIKISIFKTTTMPLRNGKFMGLDFNYLQEVCKRMNVTPVLMKSKDRYGWEENGSFFGTVGQLVYEFADASFNQFFIKDYLTRQVEFTTYITSDRLCVLVPKAPPVPDYLVIVKIFAGEVWILILLVQLVIAMIYTMLKSKRIQMTVDEARRSGGAILCCEFSRESKGFLEDLEDLEDRRDREDRCGAVMEIRGWEEQKEEFGKVHGVHAFDQTEVKREENAGRFKPLLLSCIESFGKYLTRVVLQLMQPFKYGQPWFPERLLLMCSLLFSLILNGVVTSQLASSFSKRLYYEDINTLEELEESGLEILTTSRDVLEDALTDATSPVIRRLHMRLQYANDSEVNRRLFEAKNAGFLHRFATLSLKYNEQQMESFHVVKECPKEYILANVITKGSPFRGRINSILGRLNSGGFYGKWYQSLYQSQKRAARHLHESTVHRKITIRHLLIPFAILHVGLVASAVVFACECRQKNVR